MWSTATSAEGLHGDPTTRQHRQVKACPLQPRVRRQATYQLNRATGVHTSSRPAQLALDERKESGKREGFIRISHFRIDSDFTTKTLPITRIAVGLPGAPWTANANGILRLSQAFDTATSACSSISIPCRRQISAALSFPERRARTTSSFSFGLYCFRDIRPPRTCPKTYLIHLYPGNGGRKALFVCFRQARGDIAGAASAPDGEACRGPKRRPVVHFSTGD